MATTMLICVLRLLVITSRCLVVIPYWPEPIEHVRKTMLQITHRNARWSSQIWTWFAKSQDYQTRQQTTEEGNLYGPIHTGHNQHTHTNNTRNLDLNSRVPRVHPSSRA